MKSTEYRSLLGQLPIKSPKPEDMARLCPHLTPEEAVRAFTTGEGYVACPPLRVRHGFQVIKYRRELVEVVGITIIKNHPALLEYAYAERTLASYADGMPHGDVFLKYEHADKAMRFAEENWGNELVLDDWESSVSFYIQDPTDLVNDRYHRDSPRTKVVLYVTLKRDWNKIINDWSKPESELIDEAISQMTIDHMIHSEISGGRGGFTEFNCAHCGAGLLLSSCSGCGRKFRDDQSRCGWHTPLSRKMVAFLRENGHVFQVDPEIAWEKERAAYQAMKS